MKTANRMSTMECHELDLHIPHKGAVVVVAKCPIAGKTKTRLIPLLGEDGSAHLAKAMLSDVLMTIDKSVRTGTTWEEDCSAFWESMKLTILVLAFVERNNFFLPWSMRSRS